MITFTGLVFSITIVVLQLTSGQFSPRVLPRFLRDRTIRFSLGVFVATCVYAMVVLRGVRGTSTHDGVVPHVAVTGSFLLVLLSVGMFIRYVAHVANMIRAATIVDSIGREARACLARLPPADASGGSTAVTLRPLQDSVCAPAPGVLVAINEAAHPWAGLGLRVPPAGRHRPARAFARHQRPDHRRSGDRRPARSAPASGHPPPGADSPCRRRATVRLIVPQLSFAGYLGLASDRSGATRRRRPGPPAAHPDAHGSRPRGAARAPAEIERWLDTVKEAGERDPTWNTTVTAAQMPGIPWSTSSVAMNPLTAPGDRRVR